MNKCIYYVEGPCEQQLIAALKETPGKLIPGKVKVFNVVQNLIPKSQMLSIQAGTTVVLVFGRKTIFSFPQYRESSSRFFFKFDVCDTSVSKVLNLEEELVRCTDVKKITELTKSGSVKNFKTDFCKMRTKDCRIMLDRHKLEYARLWMTRCPGVFDFVENNGAQVKTI